MLKYYHGRMLPTLTLYYTLFTSHGGLYLPVTHHNRKHQTRTPSHFIMHRYRPSSISTTHPMNTTNHHPSETWNAPTRHRNDPQIQTIRPVNLSTHSLVSLIDVYLLSASVRKLVIRIHPTPWKYLQMNYWVRSSYLLSSPTPIHLALNLITSSIIVIIIPTLTNLPFRIHPHVHLT